MPSFATTFIPLYSGGLCEAVTMIPPLYPSFLVANCRQGVGTKPHTAQSNPVDLNAADTIFDIMTLDSLPSYPIRIGPFLKKLAIDNVISETKSKVRVLPKDLAIPEWKPWTPGSGLLLKHEATAIFNEMTQKGIVGV